MSTFPTYWSLLLRTWQQEGHDGLTIPFLIGSQQYLPPQYSGSLQAISGLIEEVAVSPTPVMLKYCSHIQDFILEPLRPNKMRPPGKFPLNRGEGQAGLYIPIFPGDLGDTIEETIISLEEKYSHSIRDGRFSKDERDSGGFSGADITFIKSAFGQLPDRYFR